MAAKVIDFFPRQVLIGGGATDTTFYSPVYDVGDTSTLYHCFQLWAGSGVSAQNTSASLEDSDDPSLNNFAAVGSTLALSGDPAGTTPLGSSGTITALRRFCRAKIIVKAGKYVMVSYSGRAT